MEIPEARWIVWGTLLLFVLMIAVYVSFFFRDLALGNDQNESADLLTDFRRMREDGQLDETEYSRLKSQLPDFKNSAASTGSVAAQLNSENEVAKEEKKFLTLAEAQALKQKEAQNNEDEEE